MFFGWVGHNLFPMSITMMLVNCRHYVGVESRRLSMSNRSKIYGFWCHFVWKHVSDVTLSLQEAAFDRGELTRGWELVMTN